MMLTRALLKSARSVALPRAAVAAGPRRLAPSLPAGSSLWARAKSSDSKTPPTGNTHASSPSNPSKPPPSNSPSPEDVSNPQHVPAEEEPDLSKLPDLTQGIPSTFEQESGRGRARTMMTVEEEEAEAASGGRGKGELPASAYVSSSERRRQKFANQMYALFGALAVVGSVYLGRDLDEEEQRRHPDVANGWGLGQWWTRLTSRVGSTTSYYAEPAFEKLLPDPDPMFERPYTLCISLEDMLVHSEWTREHGWRVAKRPGVDYFLHYLSQYYEIVLFTTVPFAMGEPLVRKLDPFRFIVWPLFREATRFKDGEIVKDLSYLNRDLSKVIIIDSKASHVATHPENAIVLDPWKGDAKDKELVGLIPFLEYIHTMQFPDTRKILHSFDGKHIPTEFARREAIAREQFNKRLESERSKHPHRGAGISGLSSMLGLKPSNMSLMVQPDGEEAPSEAFAKGKMLQDIARERGQRNYEMMEAEIRKNGEKWLAEEAALQEKAQEEAMANMKTGFWGWFTPAEASQKPQENK